ncbi:hypothetical protein GCM10027161_60650 [Microbispora hainanensis]
MTLKRPVRAALSASGSALSEGARRCRAFRPRIPGGMRAHSWPPHWSASPADAAQHCFAALHEPHLPQRIAPGR